MLGLTLAAALAISTQTLGLGGAGGPSPVTVQPLGPGEVLLEVNSIGQVTTRADRVTLTVHVSGRGATTEEARRFQRTVTERVRSAASAARATSVEVIAGDTILATMMSADMAPSAEPEPAQAPRAQIGDAKIVIQLNDVARAASLREMLQAQEGVTVNAPSYALSDDKAASSAARRQATANARSEAEDYAAALGMRVVRAVRLTERVGLDFLGLMTGMISGEREMEMLGRRDTPDVTTLVSVGVDFALAPR
jgi:uncharacterized protein YggE